MKNDNYRISGFFHKIHNYIYKNDSLWENHYYKEMEKYTNTNFYYSKKYLLSSLVILVGILLSSTPFIIMGTTLLLKNIIGTIKTYINKEKYGIVYPKRYYSIGKTKSDDNIQKLNKISNIKSNNLDQNNIENNDNKENKIKELLLYYEDKINKKIANEEEYFIYQALIYYYGYNISTDNNEKVKVYQKRL